MKLEFLKEIQEFEEKLEKGWWEKSSPIPDVLYHYTDAKGLIGILEEKSIRMTHANYLNDSSELHHGWNICKELIETKIRQHKNNNLQEYLKKIILGGSALFENYLEVFVASFCKKDDLLNQWRGYGSSDGAFSIGIKTENIKLRQNLYKVEYSESEQKSYINRFLDEWIYLIEKHDIEVYPEENAIVRRCFNLNIIRALIYFKNEAFKDEQEWRVHEQFFYNDHNINRLLNFREQGGMIVPYHELSLKCDNTKKILLDSITYALSKNRDLTKKSIQLLLRKDNYDLKTVRINPSKVPLRFR